MCSGSEQRAIGAGGVAGCAHRVHRVPADIDYSGKVGQEIGAKFIRYGRFIFNPTLLI